MAHRLKRKGEDWKRRLPRPITLRAGKKLILLADCRSYVLNLDEGDQHTPQWQHAAKLMLAAAAGGSLEEVVLQFERILLHRNKIVLPPIP